MSLFSHLVSSPYYPPLNNKQQWRKRKSINCSASDEALAAIGVLLRMVVVCTIYPPIVCALLPWTYIVSPHSAISRSILPRKYSNLLTRTARDATHQQQPSCKGPLAVCQFLAALLAFRIAQPLAQCEEGAIKYVLRSDSPVVWSAWKQAAAQSGRSCCVVSVSTWVHGGTP